MANKYYRPRKEFKFWLYNDDDPTDSRLIDYIAYLRKTRAFAKTIRNGLRLMWSLGEADYSVLDELFPAARKSAQPSTPSGDFADMLKEIKQLRDAVNRQQIIGELPAPPADYPAMKPSGIQPLAGAKAVQFPIFDDDEQDTVIIRRDLAAPGKMANNFLDSVMSLQTAGQPPS